MLLLIATASTLGATAAQNDSGGLEALWFEINMGPPLVAWFNETARDNDVARVDHHSQIGHLAGITSGRKLVIFKSVAEAEQLLPAMAGQIDSVGYNLEHGPGTPPDEQADPVGSVQRMRQLADDHGLSLALGPDHDFALSHGVAMAPYVDIFVLQIQRVQTDPETVLDFVAPLVPQLRSANADLQVSVQVRTEGEVGALVSLLDSLLDYLDGVSILTSPQTIDFAQALVAALRATGDPGFRVYSPFAVVAR